MGRPGLGWLCVLALLTEPCTAVIVYSTYQQYPVPYARLSMVLSRLMSSQLSFLVLGIGQVLACFARSCFQVRMNSCGFTNATIMT